MEQFYYKCQCTFGLSYKLSDCESYVDILEFNPRVNVAVEFFFTRYKHI
jgi:hypothetical protein